MARRASGSRRRCPAPGGPAARGAAQRVGEPGCAQPRQVRHGRLACPAAPPGRRRPARDGRSTKRTATPGSQASASTSVEFDIRGSRTTATRSTALPCGGAPAGRARRRRPRRASPRRRATARAATAARRTSAVRSAPRSMSRPGSSRATSPRNLLTRSRRCSAWSAGVEQRRRCRKGGEDPAAVDVADHDHRAGRAARARPMFTMSVARRLISAGLPAPSQITAS